MCQRRSARLSHPRKMTMPQLIQTVTRYNHGNRLAGLAADGTLWEQVRDHARGGHSLKWQPIHSKGLAGHIVHLAARQDSLLVAVDSRGCVYEQTGDGQLGSQLI